MIYLQAVTKLDHLSIYFSSFQVEMCFRGQMVSSLCFSPGAEDSTAGSMPVHPGLHSLKRANPTSWLVGCKIKSNCHMKDLGL